ncbi:hypothetical protein EW026_g7017 [Hermanssonia centrifuga]|uniref:RNA helicase n=1 Tax=Hermanssonia centrifuga TaxID=98765 RepID=A0A4S4K9D3_9APHY|nr:hypothetical protein EW026_g7017 [Hermanssonia centrifuga]
MVTICPLVCSSDNAYRAHLNGRRHRAQAEGLNTSMHCAICEIAIMGKRSWAQHVLGKRHANVARDRGLSPIVEPEEAGANSHAHMFCPMCKTAIEAAFDEAAKDKHGVTVSPHPELDFGILDVGDAAVGHIKRFVIASTVPSSSINLVDFKITSGVRRSTAFSIGLDGTSQRVVYGKGLEFSVVFKQEYMGVCTDRVEFIFEDTKLKKRFLIARSLKAIVGNKAEYNAMQPKAPFIPRKRTRRDPETDIIPGDPPPALGTITYVVKLPQFPVPERMSYVLSHGGALTNIVRQFRASVLPKTLDDATYGRHFKVLLWAEEHRSERDLEVYDIQSAELTKHNSFYYLDVPGLAEKRPSVLVGDSILVQLIGAGETGKWFEGRVHIVHKENVGMRFHGSFHAGYSISQRYRARFKLNRYPLRRQHQALDTAFSPERILFPKVEDILQRTTPPVSDIRPRIHNRLIAGNPAQILAVASIVRLPAGSPPFCLFGPPGTGKTITVVEAVRQLLDGNPAVRILACAPSNSAADLIAQRLTVALSPDQLFRFYAPSRFKNQVPDDLLPYSVSTPTGHFTIPPMAALKRYRVIVTTCVSASVVYGVGMPRGHFSHIFVDEAGQATEPEVMIGIKTIADNSTNVVLAGDPKQLGPIIRSAVARELGLEKSYLERLMATDTYNIHNRRGLTVVKLVQNFRSHPAILKFPNERFYMGELEPHGDPKVIDAYIGSPLLPRAKFPIIFHALSEHLRADRRIRITDADIGVITPYHAQCLRIRMALKAVADGVKVGSVEEFQGQYEAVALLVIVGDPTVLSLDPLWRSFLNYIHINGGWKGDAPTWDARAPVRESGGYDEELRQADIENMNDFARRMESMTLQGVTEDEDEEEDNIDRPWREVE